MSLTTLTIPKRNQVNLSFNGPWLPPPDGCEGFSSFASWGNSLGNGYPRLVSSGSNFIRNTGGVWGGYYYVNVVNITDDTFYGAYHAAGTTGGHGTTASILAVGTGAFITDNAMNFKLLGIHSGGSSMSSSMGMISVDLDGSTDFDGGDTISVTINADGFIGSHNGVTPNVAWEKFNVGMGVSWLSPVSGGIPASDGYYAVTDDTDTKYNAFQNDGDYLLTRRWSHNTSDATWNYTIVSAPPKSGSGTYIQLYKWQPEAFGGSFTQTNYALQLSDGTDDALFQDFIVYTPTKPSSNGPGTADYVTSVRTNNQNTQIAGGILANPTVTEQTMFCFAPDYSWYDRIDITSDGTLSAGIVFKDLLDNYFMVGTDGGGAALYSRSSDAPPPDTGRPLRGWTFTQDDHDFYVLRLQDETYVFDKLTSQWCQWASPDLTYFSGSDGCDWQGFNVCCDPDSGDIHIIDPTGRLDGGTTPISTRIYGFVTTRFRKNVPMFMAEAAISEGRPPTGVDATTLGITLRTSDTLTWTDHGTVPGKTAGNMVTARWYGLGVASAPGVEFELSDTGYARRLDGFTIELGAAAEAAISNGQ